MRFFFFCAFIVVVDPFSFFFFSELKGTLYIELFQQAPKSYVCFSLSFLLSFFFFWRESFFFFSLFKEKKKRENLSSFFSFG